MQHVQRHIQLQVLLQSNLQVACLQRRSTFRNELLNKVSCPLVQLLETLAFLLGIALSSLVVLVYSEILPHLVRLQVQALCNSCLGDFLTKVKVLHFFD